MTEQKRIPVFDFPLVTREIGGLQCKVHRLPATRAPTVIARLISEFGLVVSEYLCTTTPAELLKQAAGIGDSTKDQLLKMGATAIKTVIASQAFVKIHEAFKDGEFVNLAWYSENMLPGYLEIAGVRIETMEELDRTQMPPLILAQMVLFALESNFDPGLGGLSTDPGSSDHQSEPQEMEVVVVPQSPAPTTSKEKGATGRKTGRGVRQRAGGSNGTSGARSQKG